MLKHVNQRDFAFVRNELTARERQVALLVMSGLRNKSIAGELQLCEGTVKIHLHNIFRKLGVTSRTALLARCHPMLSASLE
jgi:DNA-binding NarL/FixJ family response regulator